MSLIFQPKSHIQTLFHTESRHLLHDFGSQFPLGGLFSNFHQKSASKTCNFAYFTSQWGGSSPPPPLPPGYATDCNYILLTKCVGRETAKGAFGLRVKLPSAHLSTTHGRNPHPDPCYSKLSTISHAHILIPNAIADSQIMKNQKAINQNSLRMCRQKPAHTGFEPIPVTTRELNSALEVAKIFRNSKTKLPSTLSLLKNTAIFRPPRKKIWPRFSCLEQRSSCGTAATRQAEPTSELAGRCDHVNWISSKSRSRRFEFFIAGLNEEIGMFSAVHLLKLLNRLTLRGARSWHAEKIPFN